MKGLIAWSNGPVFFRHKIPYSYLFKTSILRSHKQSASLGKPAGNKLALIKPTVDRWSSSIQRTRHRIGHTLTCSDPPHCPSCYVLSVVHLLVDCPRYASLHRSLFPSIQSRHPSWLLSLVLTDSPSFNCNGLFTFLMCSTLLSDL